MAALCRDCGADPGDAGTCAACGGHRIVRHGELFSLHIAHIDLSLIHI